MKQAFLSKMTAVLVAYIALGSCAALAIAVRFGGVGFGELLKAVHPNVPGSRYDRYAGGGSFDGGGPSATPDGRWLVFSSPRTGSGDIYRTDRDGQNMVALTSGPACDVEPHVSPDGKLIAFVRETNNVGHIWIMNLEGSSMWQVTFCRMEDYGPLFLPDGKHVLFTRATGDARQSECCSIGIDGHTLVHRTTEPFNTQSASITGGLICSDDDAEGMVVIGVDGRGRTIIGKGSSPTLSPDHTAVAYLGDPYNQTVWICSMGGTHRRQILSSQTAKSHTAFSSDGRYVLFIEESSQGAYISEVKIDGSGYKRLVAR